MKKNSIKKYLWLLAVLVAGSLSGLKAQYGVFDSLYYKGVGIEYKCTGGVVLPDSSVIVSGKFSFANQTYINGLVKLRPDGTVDNTFNTGSGADDHVNVVVRQPDGKLIIAGDFGKFNGQTRNRIARLNSDGSLDGTFNTGSGFNKSVYDLYLQSDGRVMVAGLFDHFNGITANHVIRLNSDGTRDTTFTPGSGANAQAFSIDRYPGGKYILAGDFTSYNGQSVGRIVRLNSDGTVDNTFNAGAGANKIINATCILPNGKIVIGGYFTDYSGTSCGRIARLNSDGTYDNTFSTSSGFNSNVNDIVIQPDGKIIAVGGFTTFSGSVLKRVARLDSTGLRDNTFKIGGGADLSLNAVFLNTDGKIYVAGTFTSIDSFARISFARLNTNGVVDQGFNLDSKFNTGVISVGFQSSGLAVVGGTFLKYNNQTINRIARLDIRGNLDASFNIGKGFNGTVHAILVQPDDKVIVAGDFTKFNTTSVYKICRLNANGSIDNTFTVGSGFDATVYAVAFQPNGKIIVAGAFTTYNGSSVNRIVRLNANGTLDATFNSPGVNSTIYNLALQTDGKVLAVGAFTQSGFNSCRRVVRFNTDGSLDTGFNTGTGANSLIYSVAVQAGGEIVLGGRFTSFNGSSASRIVRLTTNGTVDASFSSALNNTVYNVINFKSGLLVTGSFSTANGVSHSGLVYFDQNGRIDSTRYYYNSGTSSGLISALAFNPVERRLYYVGGFESFEGKLANKLARVNAAEVELLWASETICPGANFYLKCKSLNTLNAGNTYKVELSDSAGNFTYATVVGTKNSTTQFDSVLITIPGGIIAGDNYRLRVLTTQPADTSYYSAPFAIHIPPTPTVSVSGPTTFCQGNSVTLTCQTANAYMWSSGVSTPFYKALTSGNYVVSASYGYACTGVSAPIAVTVNPAPDSSIKITGVSFCNSGSAQLSGNAGYNYLWSTGSTAQTISVATAGTYTLSLTNSFGCTSDSSLFINPANMSSNLINPNNNTAICQGQSITLSSIPATGVTYNWSTSQTTQSITVSAAGNYSVTVTDSSNCSATSSVVTISLNALPNATITAPVTQICSGNAVALSAQPGLLYSWSNGQTDSTIMVSAAGLYTVTVTNSSNCSATSSVTLTNGSNVSATITAAGSTTICSGANVLLNAPAGYNYNWSTGATTQSISAANAGTYSVTVTDAQTNCSAVSNTVTVSTLALPDATISSTATQICPFSYATLSGKPGLVYNWSNNQHTSTIVASPGTYGLTVTDGSGCSASGTYVLNSFAMPDTNIYLSGPKDICSGDTLVLSAGTGFQYHWSNSYASQTISVSSTGTYTVTVTDPNTSCTAKGSVDITVKPTPVVTYDLPQSFICNSSAVITLNPGMPAGGMLFVNGVQATQIDPAQYANTNVVVTYIVPGSNGCDGYQQDSVYIAVCTDVQEANTDNEISVYPNPATNFLVVYNPAAVLNRLTVVDMLGQTVLEQNAEGESHVRLNIQGLATGNYFLIAGNKKFKFMKTE